MTDLAELHDELRAVARRLLVHEVSVDDRWRQIADAGWLGLEIPESFGGAGATFSETAVVLEELGRAAASTAFLGTAVLGVGAALAAQPCQARDRLLTDIAAATARVAVAMTPHADAVVARPSFVLDGDRVLSGRADFVVDASAAEHLLVLADRPDQPSALVHVKPHQVLVTERPLVDATRSVALVEITGAVVDPDDVWPFAGNPHAAAQRVVDRAAASAAADSLGVASAMLDATVDYVGQRHQFDRPIGSFQAVKHRCADMAVSLRVGRQLLDAAVASLTADGDPVEVEAAVSRASSFLGTATVDVAGGAMQLHGGIGYTWEGGIHTHLKRALLDRALFGSPATHRRRIARRFGGSAASIDRREAVG